MTSALNPGGYGTEDEYEEEVLNSLHGPFYSSTGVMRLLDVPSKQALSPRSTHRRSPLDPTRSAAPR